MRCIRLTVLLGLFCMLLPAAKKPLPGEAQNDKVELLATIMPNEQVNSAFGYDFQDHFTVLEIRLVPKAGPMDVRLDDFLLRTDKDGEKSTPFVASQIAGSGALVVTRTQEGGGVASGNNGRGWSLPGSIGRPRQMPGDGGGAGNTAPVEGRSSRVSDEKGDKELKAKLAARMLPEKTVTEAVSGLLFFSLEKQKVKDLELIYTPPGTTTSEGKLRLRLK